MPQMRPRGFGALVLTVDTVAPAATETESFAANDLAFASCDYLGPAIAIVPA
jgi:hypothetical protein